MPVKFRLYSRAGCYLCDEMLKDLEALRRTTADPFTVEVWDIDSDPESKRLYSQRIPVLIAESDGKILCEIRLQRQPVLEYLAVAAD